MKRIWFIITLWIAKFCNLVAKILGKSGSVLSGNIALKLQKDFLGYIRGIDLNKTIFITGTNGKSTTNNLIVHTIRSNGHTITTNLEGANAIHGVTSAIIKDISLLGKLKNEYLVLETDERYLVKIHSYIKAKNICVTNIQKDQVQRNGEPNFIYNKIKSIISKDTNIFINNDEPRSKSFEDLTKHVVYYGVTKNEKSFTKKGFYDVTMPCPKCGNKIEFDYYNVDNIGKFKCSRCDYSNNKDIKYYINKVDFNNKEFELNKEKYTMPYTQAFFLYDYALSIAVLKTFGFNYDEISSSFKSFKNITGRFEIIEYKDKKIKYLRIKQENPETLQSAFDYVAEDKTKKVFMIGLEQLEDFDPHYTNTFYSFDCDLDNLINSNIEKIICFSQAVSYDTANRFIYANFPKNKIVILPTDSDEAIFEEIDKLKCDNIYLITWLHKYEELIRDIAKMESDNNE